MNKQHARGLPFLMLQLLLLSLHVEAQSITNSTLQLLPTLGPSSASANDQRLLFTSDYCNPAQSQTPQQTLGLQAREDPMTYLILCTTGLLVLRWNVSTSTQLIFPVGNGVINPPLTITQHPITGHIFYANGGGIYSFPWNASNQSTFSPPLTQRGYNRTMCPFFCNSVDLVIAPDGSHFYVACSLIPCPFQSPAFVVAVELGTNHTMYINTTAEQRQIGQNVTQLSLVADTNELLIVSMMYGITIYDMNKTMAAMQSHNRSSTPVHVLLNGTACYSPAGTIIDRHDNLLMAICYNQTKVWNLTSETNISVDPSSSAVLYPQTPLQSCAGGSLLYHHAKRTLYQSCSSGPDRVFALQNFDTPQSVVFSSLVNVDTCSSTSFMLIDRTQPDVLYSMCAEGVVRMEGRGLTPILTGAFCQQQISLVYDWRTDTTYVTCGLSSPPLICIRNHELEVLMTQDDCLNPGVLILDDTIITSPQLFLLCGNSTNNINGSTTIWNISLALADQWIAPQPVFTLPGSDVMCATPNDGIFYCFVDQAILFTYNISTPEIVAQPTDLILLGPYESSIGICANWLFMNGWFQTVVLGIPLNRIGIDEPTIFFGNPTGNSSTAVQFTNIACDHMRKTVSIATSTNYVDLIQINVSDSINPIVNVHSFDPGMNVTVEVLGIDTKLNRVYIILNPNSPVNSPDFQVVFHGDIQRFVSSIVITKLAAPFATSIFVDSYTSQVFLGINAQFDNTYNQLLVLTSGWRCTTGTTWYQGQCAQCPIGESRSIVLSTDESTYSIPQCVACGSGAIANTVGTIECTQCEVGRFADINVGQVCSLCTGGYYANQSGSTACSPCESGRFSNKSEASSCYVADEGYYVSVASQSMQLQCISGRYSNASGLTNCYECEAGSYASGSGSTSCLPCELGRFSGSAASDCPTCSVDAYTPRIGADCLSCADQKGLICINGLASVAAGWWPYLINDTSFDPPLMVYRTTQCPPGYCDGAELQFTNESSSTNLIQPQLCTSPRLNSPDNWLCAECEDGYIPWGSSCEPCTGPAVGLICGALILTFIITYVLLRIDPAASPLTILFFFVQIAALEIGDVTRWIDWIQFANLGAHSFQRCLAPITPAQQMILTLCIPFLLMAALGLLCALHRLISKYVTSSAWYQSAVTSATPTRFTRFVEWCSMTYDRDRYLGAINAILIFCYTPVTVTVVSALHCADVGPGVSRLFSTPSVDCHSTEYRALLLPFVYVWLCCYVIGLPLFMLLFVWWRWQTVATILAASDSSLSGGASMDQVGGGSSHDSSSSLNYSSIISVMHAHDDSLLPPEPNPISSSHSFDARWGHFYRRYRLTAWYWQPIEMLQRFAFALTSVLLIKNTHARYSLYSTISIISLSANLWSRPFASNRMNQVALIAYFLLSFVSFLLNGQEPPYSLSTQLMFFGLIVPFSIILLIWGVRLNMIGMQKYMKMSDGRIVSLPPRISRSASQIVASSSFPPPMLSQPSSSDPLLPRTLSHS